MRKLQKKYFKDKDIFASIRKHAVSGLKYCNENKVKELLKIGLLDPNDDIKTVSREILNQKYK